MSYEQDFHFFLALKDEEGIIRQEIQAVSRNWERKGSGFSPKVSRTTLSIFPILWMRKTRFRFQSLAAKM